jgi:hypothetical protein
VRWNIALLCLGAVVLVGDVALWNWRVGVGVAASCLIAVGVLRDDGRPQGEGREGRGGQ